jgi:hypothetical protein
MHSRNMPAHAFVLELPAVCTHKHHLRDHLRCPHSTCPRRRNMDEAFQKVYGGDGHRFSDGGHWIRCTDIRIQLPLQRCESINHGEGIRIVLIQLHSSLSLHSSLASRWHRHSTLQASTSPSQKSFLYLEDKTPAYHQQ